MNDIDSCVSCRVAKGHLELMQQPASVPAEEARLGIPRQVRLSPLEFVAFHAKHGLQLVNHYLHSLGSLLYCTCISSCVIGPLSVGITQAAELAVAALSHVNLGVNCSIRSICLLEPKLRLPGRVILCANLAKLGVAAHVGVFC